MTMQTVTSNIASRATAPSGWSIPSLVSPAEAGRIVVSFLDAATTSLGRATHYNTREEQQKAELLAHDALLWLDRELYTILLALSGVTDRARQVGLKNLLSTPRVPFGKLLDDDAERRLLGRLVDSLPPPRLLKLFEGLRVGSPEDGLRKANNARTRKLILRTLLGSARFELWSVKYRSKIGAALKHAWGVRKASILRSILSKGEAEWTAKERAIVRGEIDRFVAGDLTRARACVAFVLGRPGASAPLLLAYEAAKVDITAGAKLPLEVLEGIRSVFHRSTPKERVLELTRESLTRAQRMSVQRRAESAKVDVQMDPMDYDPVRLYLYAFEMGMTVEIAGALLAKAEKAARSLLVRYQSIGILLDASASMEGATDARLRPMATALSLRDMLLATSAGGRVIQSAGEASAAESMLVRPAGDTSLARGLCDLLESAPEAVFVISDGYENRPAGRFAEVVSALRALGNTTPIFHLNPVYAAESSGVRELAPGLVPTLPASRPEALGLSMIRGLLSADPARGIAALVRLALPALRGTEDVNRGDA